MNAHKWGIVRTCAIYISCIIAILLVVTSLPQNNAEAQGAPYTSGYSSKFEYESIRNQERIIRLLEEQNRILERRR